MTSLPVSSTSSPTQRSLSALSTSPHSHNSLAFLRDRLLSPSRTSTAAVTSASVVSLVRPATQPTALVVSPSFSSATRSYRHQYHQSHHLTLPSQIEPLFYLHHAQVDHVYWQWQQKNPAVRLHEVGGKTIRNDATSPNVTDDFKVNLGAIAPSIPISDLLDTEGGVLCYTYE